MCDERYDAGNEQAGDRPALRFYARVAARLAPRGSHALDFGSGTGHSSKHLARRFRTTPFDPSPYAREATARTSPRTRVIEDLDRIADGDVDVVCALHVLEHIPDPAPMLRHFHRLLAPRGRLLYRDPTHCTLLSSEDWLERTRYLRVLPRRVQLPLFGAPAALQVVLGHLFLPPAWGEGLVVVAERG